MDWGEYLLEPLYLREMPSNPGWAEYFWFNLPYAMPGIITFSLGIFLSLFSLVFFWKDAKKSNILIYTGLFFSVGFLGLIMGLRSIIIDKEIWNWIHQYLYWIVLFSSQFGYLIYYHITYKKFKSILYFSYVNLIIILIALFSCITGDGFTGDWIDFSFGIYPVVSLPLKLWSVFAGLGYLTVCIPAYYRLSIKERSEMNKNVLLGLYLLPVLLFTNLPALYGYAIFPLGSFTFIPLILIAYGLFNSNLMNLKTYLIEKGALFNLVTTVYIGLCFLICICFINFLSPHSETSTYSVYNLFPLFSVISSVAIAVMISGQNPSIKLNLVASGVLISASFIQISLLFMSMDIDPVIQRRIEQISFLFFAFFPALIYRLLFEVMNKKTGKIGKLIDFTSISVSALSFSPFLFGGYYKYKFGTISQTNILFIFFSLVSFIGFIHTIIVYSRNFQSLNTLRTKWIFGAYFIFAFLYFLNIPAVNGFPLYPFANLTFIPSLFLGLGILTETIGKKNQYTNKMSKRYNLFSVIFIAGFGFVYYNNLDSSPDNSQLLLHTICLMSFIFLIYFLSSYGMSRSVISLIDQRHTEQLNIQEEINSAIWDYEKIKDEVSRLNMIQTKINSTMDFSLICDELALYLEEKYSILGMGILTLDKDKIYLKTDYIKLFQIENRELFESKIMEYKSPASRKNIFYNRMLKNQNFQIPNYPSNRLKSELDRELVSFLSNYENRFHILNFQNEIYGLVFILFDQDKIPEINISFLEIVSGLLSSSIKRLRLFEEITESKLTAQKLTKNLQFINDIVQSINSGDPIQKVMEDFIHYLRENYFLEYYALYSFGNLEGKGVLLETNLNKDHSINEFNKLLNFKITDKNIHSFILNKKKIVYLEKLNLTICNSLEKEYAKENNLKAAIFIPLIIQGKVIGILDLFSSHTGFRKITKKSLYDLKEFASQISSALQKKFLIRELEESKEKSEAISNDLQLLNEMSKIFNDTLNPQEFTKIFEKYFIEKFNFRYYSLSTFDSISQTTKYLSSNVKGNVSDELYNLLKKSQINLKEKKGGHFLAFTKKRLIYFPRLKISETTESERLVVESLNAKSMMICPLFHQGEIVGFLDFMDDSEKKRNREELLKVEQYASQIVSSINNANLSQNLNQAYKELEDSKDQLIQSEKMVALGQLVKGVAHELNTPLGAIKASVGNLNQLMNEILDKYPNIISLMQESDWNFLESILKKSAKNKNNISTKEERLIRKSLENKLASLIPDSVSDISDLSDNLVDMGIYEWDEEWNSIWESKNYYDIFNLAYSICSILKIADNINISVDKASKIVFALKNYSHFELTKEKSLFPVSEGIETVLTIYQNSLKHGIDIKKEYLTEDTVYCYPDELNQVWTNLIHNSIQAMPDQGRILIRITQEPLEKRKSIPLSPLSENDLVIEIQDSGEGVSDEMKDKIFDPFFTTKNRGEGSGLGLYISRQIVDKHGGEISFTSQPGQTVFTIRIPYLKKIE